MVFTDFPCFWDKFQVYFTFIFREIRTALGLCVCRGRDGSLVWPYSGAARLAVFVCVTYNFVIRSNRGIALGFGPGKPTRKQQNTSKVQSRGAGSSKWGPSSLAGQLYAPESRPAVGSLGVAMGLAGGCCGTVAARPRCVRQD